LSNVEKGKLINSGNELTNSLLKSFKFKTDLSLQKGMPELYG